MLPAHSYCMSLFTGCNPCCTTFEHFQHCCFNVTTRYKLIESAPASSTPTSRLPTIHIKTHIQKILLMIWMLQPAYNKWSSHSQVEDYVMAKPWPHCSTFLDNYDDCEEQAFFQCGAVELAEKLLGQYLYCHQSEIVVRIVETQAFPEADARVYNNVFFLDPGEFKIKGGTMLARKSALSNTYAPDEVHLFITAGAEDCGDVVHLRSCQPIEGQELINNRRKITKETTKFTKRNVLVGPSKVPEGLGNEWEENPILYEPGGVQLFYGTVPPKESLMCGQRHLPERLSEINTDDDYRFALKTQNPTCCYYNNNALKLCKR